MSAKLSKSKYRTTRPRTQHATLNPAGLGVAGLGHIISTGLLPFKHQPALTSLIFPRTRPINRRTNCGQASWEFRKSSRCRPSKNYLQPLFMVGIGLTIYTFIPYWVLNTIKKLKKFTNYGKEALRIYLTSFSRNSSRASLK